ncbi:MAG: hypothetical protein ACT4O0_15665 [Pseudonocardia sp.]|jgi:hypothetical protein
MGKSPIHALLMDGPRAGEVIELSPRPDGKPPEQIIIADPLASTTESSEATDRSLRQASTYHLAETGDESCSYVYLAGQVD